MNWWIQKIRAANDSNLVARGLAVVVGIGILAIRLPVGPIMGVDWESYVNSVIIRTPLYPIFLNFFVFLFGEHWKEYTYVFQILLVLSAAIYFASVVRRVYRTGNGTFLVVLMLGLTPAIGHNGIGNKYYSEALSYSLFLFFFAFFLKATREKGKWNPLWVMVLTMLCTLARPQLIILYIPVLLLLAFVHREHRNWRRTFRSALVFVLIAAGGALAGRLYNLAVHGIFSSVPFSGMNISTSALYASDPEKDLALFPPGSRERKLLEAVYERMETRRLFLRYNDAPNFLETQIHYARSYDAICWATVYDLYRETFTRVSKTDHWLSPDEFADLDRVMVNIAFRLIPRHMPELAKLYTANILFKMGGFYYPFLLLAVLFLSGLRAVRYRHSLDFALFTITVLNFLNYGLVGVLQRLMTRYTFYTDTLQLVFLVLWLLWLAGGARQVSASSHEKK